MKKNFYSDNVAGASPEILRALVAANAGDTAPYGSDPWTERLPARFGELFETEVEVYPVGTGTAANGLAASIVAAPYGAVYCSDVAHLHGSECGGAEFWSGGSARSVPLPTRDGFSRGGVRPATTSSGSPAPSTRPRRLWTSSWRRRTASPAWRARRGVPPPRP